MDELTILILCVAGALGMVVFFVMKVAMGGNKDTKLRDRLNKAPSDAQAVAGKKTDIRSDLKGAFSRLGQAAAQPFMPTNREKISGLRQSLNKAGLYNPSTMRTLMGAKMIFLVAGVLGGYAIGVVTDKLFLMFSLGGIIGYMAPQLWLRMRINANQKSLTFGLPDALDLMVVCVEAGLTVDAAMQRVGQELGLAHPAIAREFGIAHMETRVGLTRGDSLKNIGTRTGNAGLQSLAAMLVQADRFGTSIAQALRVHAETLRLSRQHAAEEMAAKASVKISFPLVLFIFPSTFIVLCGPVIIELMGSSLYK